MGVLRTEQHRGRVARGGADDALGPWVQRVKARAQAQRRTGQGRSSRSPARRRPRPGAPPRQNGASVSAPATASTRVTTRARRSRWSSIGSVPSVNRIGPGSARPLVSTTRRPNRRISPASRRSIRLAQRLGQILAHGAAQAAARQFQDLAFDEIDEVMVDRDLADLVDHDRGVGKCRVAQRAAQQRRFAAAEKSGQQRDRQCCPRRARRSCQHPKRSTRFVPSPRIVSRAAGARARASPGGLPVQAIVRRKARIIFRASR